MLRKSVSVAFVTFFCIVALVMSGLMLTVSAEVVTGDCGDNLTWYFDTVESVLTISGSGDMYDYSTESYNSTTRTTAPWKTYSSDVKSVVISDGVTSIGNNAFYRFKSLNSVSIGDSVSKTGKNAFYNCSALVNAYIDDIGAWCNIAFNGYTSNPLYFADKLYINGTLTGNLIIPDTVNAINSYAFYNCSALTSVSMGDSVTNIGYRAFGKCSSLESVTFGDFVEKIEDEAFSGCSSLTGITLPDSVTYFGGSVFKECTSLTYAVIGNSITDVKGQTFAGCSDLVSVTLGESVAKIGTSAFIRCGALTSIIIPDAVTEIEDNTFEKCTSLADVTIGDFVTEIGVRAFAECSSLKNIVIPDSVINISTGAFKDCTSLESVKLSNSLMYLDAAFGNCTSLKSISFPDTLEKVPNYAFDGCTSLESAEFADSIIWIGSGAFRNCTSLTNVVLPGFVIGVTDRCFEGCTSLAAIAVPDSVTSIGYNAIPLTATIKCYVDSYAHSYAINKGYNFELICKHIFTDYVSDNNASCTEDGTKTSYCDNGCGVTNTVTDDGSALGHSWGDFSVAITPSTEAMGEYIRYCSLCGDSETKSISNLKILSTDNYTVKLSGITNVKEIRFAIGHYTKGTDIKAAEKNVTLDAATVKKYTTDDVMTYDLPWMGEYTFWVRYNDGSQYFIYTNIDDITPYAESYGVKLTVKDYAENYKDMWIAKGSFNSYSEIKASTAFKYQASANKLDLYAPTTHDFSYTLTDPGDYTVLIRYNDGTFDVIHHELTVDYPEFSANGLQVTVQNIPDIKIIRTAYGHYTSVGDIKKASGVRNFSNKTDIKNADDYMIQYRTEGEVTLIVEYNNGYKHFCYLNIQPKSATMIQSKNTVMFDDLDGFVMIRYAKGVYTTSAQIKAAAGSKVLKPADLIGGYAIISDLEAGTYTFCVQFDDESYDYYTVTVE